MAAVAVAEAISDQEYNNTSSPVTMGASFLSRLNDKQRELMGKLREDILNNDLLDDTQKNFCDDICLFRYLSGLHWNLDIAKKNLMETLEWRKSYQPDKITYEDVKLVADSGFITIPGFDKAGHPIVYIKMSDDKLEDTPENALLKFKLLVYVSEKAITLMKGDVYQITWVVDLQDNHLTLSTVKSTKEMFAKLGVYYTERLYRVLALNVPWTFSVLWAVIKPFLEKETQDKYTMLRGSQADTKKVLCESIDEGDVDNIFARTNNLLK